MVINKLRFFQNLLSLSAVTLIVVVWATVSYLAYQNKLLQNSYSEVIKSNSNTNKEDKSLEIIGVPNDWKTYFDDEYFYSIKYPSNWIYNDAKPPTFTSPEIQGPPRYHLILTAYNNPTNTYDDVLFRVWGGSCIGSCPEEGGDLKKEGVDFRIVNPTLETKKINDTIVYYLISYNKRVNAIIPIPNKNMYLVVNPNFWPKDENYELFDQILSTFEFTSNANKKCAKYTYNGITSEYCAVCENNICEEKEKCSSSVCSSDGICTADCGSLYCPADCEE